MNPLTLSSMPVRALLGVAALWSVALGHGLAMAGASPGAVSIRVSPAQVVLGGSGPTSVKVDIELAGASAAPYVYATAGRIVDLKRVDARRFSATLEPPKERFPQIALVAAVAFGRDESAPPEVAAATVSYSARIELKGRLEKRATVVLDVAGQRFGPATPGTSGDFVVPIVVPPGENWATSTATDTAGNRSRSRINLYLPSVRRLHAFSYPEALVADGLQHGWVFGAAVNAAGQPDAAPVSAAARRGKIGAGLRSDWGVWRFPYGAPLHLGEGNDVVTLKTTDGLTLDSRVALLAGAAARLTTDYAPQPVPADGTAGAKLTVALMDKGDNPVAGQKPRLELDGAVLWASEPSPGHYIFDLPARDRAGSVNALVSVAPAPVLSCVRPRAFCAERQLLIVDARGVPCLGEVTLAASARAGETAAVLTAEREGIVPLVECSEQPVDFRAADGRLHQIALRPAATVAEVKAAVLSSAVTVVWRLPAPVVLRWRVAQRKGNDILLVLAAEGLQNPAERVTLEASAGRLRVTAAKVDAIETVLQRVDQTPVDVVATERESGVSAWIRVP